MLSIRVFLETIIKDQEVIEMDADYAAFKLITEEHQKKRTLCWITSHFDPFQKPHRSFQI